MDPTAADGTRSGVPKVAAVRPAGHAVTVELEALIEALLRPGALPGDEVVEEVRQTHASVVFLTREHAWKLKKPVDFGFLDYSTPRKRALLCRREVELNRRLAPGVYLGVAKVRQRPDGSVGVGSRGPIVDSLVKMRRLSDRDSLAERMADGRAGEAEARAVARRLAAFHRDCREAPVAFDAAEAFQQNQAENFRDLGTADGSFVPAGFVHEMAGEVGHREDTVLAELRQRQAAGWVRDGHGDLRMDHVYIEDGRIEVIDCIEFNDQFRYADVALDRAFLAMDLESKGYPDLARALLDEHRRELGDGASDSLTAAYLSYRAMVRAKVAFLAASEPELGAEGREVQKLKAVHSLLHAWRFSTGERQPRLMLTMGLAGTGKSTVAGVLSGLLGAQVISADETRKRLAGLGEHEHPVAGIETGLYSEAMNARVYAALHEAAAGSLRLGRSVVLDATYQRAADRVAARAVAQAHGGVFTQLLCEAPEPVVKERLRLRAQGAGDRWSDAGWDVYEAQRARFEWPVAAEERWTVRVAAYASRVEIARELMEMLTLNEAP